MAICRLHNRIGCTLYAWGKDPDGLCLLHSRQENKDQDGQFTDEVKKQLAEEDYNFQFVFFPGPANFFGKKFTKEARFDGAIFSGEAKFSTASFSIGANFSGVNFFKRADFFEAIFSGEANFIAATFSAEADFNSVAFFANANFSHATFSAVAAFSWVTFTKEAAFSEATFKELGAFSEASFLELADFSKATISGRMVFISINPSTKPFRGDFIGLELSKEAILRFQDLSLAQVRFYGTDLWRPEFHHVAWHRLRGGR